MDENHNPICSECRSADADYGVTYHERGWHRPINTDLCQPCFDELIEDPDCRTVDYFEHPTLVAQ